MEPINFAYTQVPQPRTLLGTLSSPIGALLKTAFPRTADWQEGIREPWQGPMRVEWEDTQ